MSTITTVLIWFGLAVAMMLSFYWDWVRHDRSKAAYHLAWAGIFLACLALSGSRVFQ